MGGGSAAATLAAAAVAEDLGTLTRMLSARATNGDAQDPRYQATTFEAMCAAAAAGRADSLGLLLQCGVAVDGRDGGATALMHAASHGHLECMRRLLIADADPNAAVPGTGMTAYHAACLHDQPRAATALLCAGADSEARAGKHISMTGLEMAESRGAQATAERVLALLRRRGKLQAAAQLLDAATVGDLPTLEHMLWTGAWRTLEGGRYELRDTRLTLDAIRVAFHAAARACQPHCLPVLLDSLGGMMDRAGGYPPPRAGWMSQGVDLAGQDGQTALMLACAGGGPDDDIERVEAVEWLLARGADANAADSAGLTSLHRACLTGHESAAWAVLRGGAAYETLTAEGEDCVSLAVRGGFREMAAVRPRADCATPAALDLNACFCLPPALSRPSSRMCTLLGGGWSQPIIATLIRGPSPLRGPRVP